LCVEGVGSIARLFFIQGAVWAFAVLVVVEHFSFLSNLELSFNASKLYIHLFLLPSNKYGYL
jgi:hypothetical protein